MNDLIDRQDAIEALANGALINYQAAGSHNGLVKAIDVIKGLPSAQPKTGRWMQWTKGRVMCSICGEEPYHGKGADRLNFCPHCGSKMEDPSCRE